MTAAVRLAAALRREAHDIECRTSPQVVVLGGSREHAERLLDRAERLDPTDDVRLAVAS